MCAVPWGCSEPWGYHEYCGGYHEYHGGYHEYRGDNVGDILSTMGVFSTVGDIMMHLGEYHEYRGGIS